MIKPLQNLIRSNQAFARLAVSVFLLSSLSSYAEVQSIPDAKQDLNAVKVKVEEFLTMQTIGYPGKVTVSATPVDRNLKLPACPQMQVFLPPGSRVWGRTNIGVSCDMPVWKIYLQANISVMSQYLTAAAPLTQGRVVTSQDLMYQSGDLAQLPSGIFTDPEQVIGRTVSVSLQAGTVLRQEMLKMSPVVLQGQKVVLNSIGDGFQVSAEGQALTTAGEGQVVQVKVASGQVISGIARNGGQIDVRF
ncbi:flagellar basal body P-ring formation chaperone FlgA [Methyloradius palustris]|uniref:Flagella basal body P-ring formation protein FlgA n=1 Tax=Methyloradius palustris TaxID=2778876 RepID=A0A8D5JWU2_9PROT|nr:flagellar basal body P-ring formation chaperone FlgA [Methyloradius palustris]BCM25454.1 flagellar basal body P-ring biosynthesis protein FlgA [Methyloradius palustris]